MKRFICGALRSIDDSSLVSHLTSKKLKIVPFRLSTINLAREVTVSQTRAQRLGSKLFTLPGKIALIVFRGSTRHTKFKGVKPKYLHLNVCVIHLMAFVIKLSVIHALSSALQLMHFHKTWLIRSTSV